MEMAEGIETGAAEMKLELTRDIFKDEFTLGKLYADNKLVGYTCEDKDRKLEDGGGKVYGTTAIPRGLYKIVLSFSPHFGKVLPELLNVPGFAGIRIHGGNTAADSLGCILLGACRQSTGVCACAGAMARLINLIEQAEDIGEEAWITIS